MENPGSGGGDDRADGRRSAARRAWRFARTASGLLALLMIAFATATRLEVFGAGFHVNFALVLGVAGTILLGVGLMALSFYSDRAGVDDGVVGMNKDEWGEEDRAP